MSVTALLPHVKVASIPCPSPVAPSYLRRLCLRESDSVAQQRMLTCYRCLPALSGWPMRAGPFFLLGNSVDLCIPFFVVPPVEFNRGKLHHPARSPSRARGPVCFLSVGCPTFSICGDAQFGWQAAFVLLAMRHHISGFCQHILLCHPYTN